MSNVTSVHSNAFSFMSFTRGGVDPRTGLYTLSIDLPSLKSYALNGPDFNVALTFNPLNTADSGFGRGWNLGLTQYTPHNQVLALSSGESYRLEDSNREDKRLTVPQQKIASFHVYKEGNAALGATTRFRVEHRSGLKEILELQGGRVALPVGLVTLGHKLKLKYVPFDSDHRMLASVSEVDYDGTEYELLTINRSSGRVEIREHSLGVGSIARFILTLEGSDNRVGKIILPTANAACWELGYQYDPSLNYLSVSWVRTPTGAREDLEYTDGGHPFPSASGRPALPRVNRHTKTLGKADPELEIEHALIDVRYAYDNSEPDGWGRNNFLGDDATPWGEDDGLDNLYKRQGRFVYGMLETQWVDDIPVKVTERRFNRFHLLTLESTRQGNAVQDTLYTYPVNEERPFEQQPANFQLATEEQKRWRLVDNSWPPRSQSVASTYDNYGNLIWRKRVNEVEEAYVWYPVEGEENACPPDPEGFVRHLKQATLAPAPTGFGKAPTLTRHYTYIRLPAVFDSEYDEDDPDNAWRGYGRHQVDSETLKQDERLLEQTCYTIFNDPDDAFLHGRIQRNVLSYPGADGALSTTKSYAYSLVDGRDADEPVVQTEETITGYDGAVKIITLQHSIIHGEPVLNRDDSDVEIAYTYDALRRVTFETVGPGTQYEASRKYEYHLCAHANDRAEQSMFDVKGVKTRSVVNGLNQVVYEARNDDDSRVFAGAPRSIYRARYNGLGQLQTQTEIDWLGDALLELTSTFEYDDWGEQSCETGPDGVANFAVTDPLGTTEHRGPITKRWRVGTDGRSSGVSETWLNLFEEPTRLERYTVEGEGDEQIKHRESLKVLRYDGLGRLHEERDGEGDATRINEYGYDAFDRILEHTLPGGAIVYRTYAGHSRDDLPVSIKVGTVLLGTQAFDGLGRRTRATTGYREQTFRYKDGELQPRWVTMPSGEEVTYEYSPVLNEEPTKRVLGGIAANYEYDRQNARLLKCDVPDQSVTREYFTHGEVKSEVRVVEGDKYTMRYDYSYRSRMLSYTDVLGQTQQYDYDEAGRLQQTRLQGALPTKHRRASVVGPLLLQADFTYDEFGRTQTFTTTDILTGNQLTTSLEYDAFDREVTRTFNFGDGNVQRLTQWYDAFDGIVERHLEDVTAGVLLRQEGYVYDTRGRLVRYSCTAADNSSPENPDDHYWPQDPYGNKIKAQVFTFSDIDNITLVLSTFVVGSNRARYYFGDPAKREDPAQLLRITNTHASYDKDIALRYDLNGNLTTDEVGRTLRYDALNRLLEVRPRAGSANEPGVGASYHYDAENILSGTSPL
ncbi:hypothetical protein V7V80_17075 [Pseudomonas kermanshahensis]|uniref:YD repeat-containing protein n=1 Tax=Pseudomonas kermanshahensis TaxID=2745482 RepID=A0ABU8R993_9PSED|nr:MULTISPECIES: RHS repeat protein [Pseudomonas]MBC3498042.1 RHS repeat protein [Pseudomonas sp. SWRI67]MBV4525573.1 hypothetical protein [Pseudomonas kermanshahensis]